MAFMAATNDALAPAAPATGFIPRLLLKIMEARQAQARWRLAWQLRDLPGRIDIGLTNSEVKRLRARQSAYLSG